MNGTAPETCEECGFDSRRWRIRDAASVFDELGFWWDHATRGLDRDVLNRRPQPEVWSALEYGFHTALVTAIIRTGLEMILADDGCQLPSPPATADEGRPLELDPKSVIDDIRREGQALAEVAHSREAVWTNVGLLDGQQLQAETLLIHAAHDATHHFMDVGRGLVAVGSAAPATTARLKKINISPGGVPKTPTPHARIDYAGLEGDRQRDRKHHGRPFQAVCLWSQEVIDGLAASGHPISAGCAGENLTVSGLDWPELRPGTRLRAGDALLEISFPSTPCHNQTQWFSDGDFSRIGFERDPTATRWYAWVREPGDVVVGDPVTTPA
jgi:MOSC domain-containing protein YiiM